ncbi:hypothetical protein VTL71DRAFT_7079 [Oculimacula yallundae]|uniref:Uncharacterized protein n=1 Tax=Oculimacula yallundae TaxID=86028 RepID=A0ABR4BWU7_9HELO
MPPQPETKGTHKNEARNNERLVKAASNGAPKDSVFMTRDREKLKTKGLGVIRGYSDIDRNDADRQVAVLSHQVTRHRNPFSFSPYALRDLNDITVGNRLDIVQQLLLEWTPQETNEDREQEVNTDQDDEDQDLEGLTPDWEKKLSNSEGTQLRTARKVHSPKVRSRQATVDEATDSTGETHNNSIANWLDGSDIGDKETLPWLDPSQAIEAIKTTAKRHTVSFEGPLPNRSSFEPYAKHVGHRLDQSGGDNLLVNKFRCA